MFMFIVNKTKLQMVSMRFIDSKPHHLSLFFGMPTDFLILLQHSEMLQWMPEEAGQQSKMTTRKKVLTCA